MDEQLKQRYDRHIRLSEIGPEGQQKLRDASVLLVGVGGLGSPISLYLTAAGIGRLGIVDADVVSESNLQRQVLYSEFEVGLPKVECARRRLQKLNSDIRIDTYQCRFDESNAEEMVERYDIVVDGCDNYATRYLIDRICGSTGKPYVYGTIGEFKGQLGVFNHNGGMSYRDLYPEEDNLASVKPGINGVMGVVPGVIGTLQAAEVVKLITGAGETLSNKLLVIDLLTMEINKISF